MAEKGAAKPLTKYQQRVVDRIKARSSKGLQLDYGSVKRDDIPLISIANYNFGTYAEALKAAGFDPKKVKAEGRALRFSKRHAQWRKEIIEAIRLMHLRDEPLNVSSFKGAGGARLRLYKRAEIPGVFKGGWPEAVDTALGAVGLKYEDVGSHRRIVWTRKLFLQRLKELHDSGQSIHHWAMETRHRKIFRAGIKYFKNWAAAVKAAGYDYSKIKRSPGLLTAPIRKWDEEKVLAVIKERHAAGETLNPRNKEIHSTLVAAGRRHFGSWPAAIEAYIAREKLPLKYDDFLASERWTRERILENIKLLPYEKMRSTAMKADPFLFRLYASGAHHFGSWSAAVEAAGRDYSKVRNLMREEVAERKRKWTKKQITDLIRAYSQQGGVHLTYAGMKDDEFLSKVYGTGNRIFGGWSNALKAADLNPEKVRQDYIASRRPAKQATGVRQVPSKRPTDVRQSLLRGELHPSIKAEIIRHVGAVGESAEVGPPRQHIVRVLSFGGKEGMSFRKLLRLYNKTAGTKLSERQMDVFLGHLHDLGAVAKKEERYRITNYFRK